MGSRRRAERKGTLRLSSWEWGGVRRGGDAVEIGPAEIWSFESRRPSLSISFKRYKALQTECSPSSTLSAPRGAW